MSETTPPMLTALRALMDGRLAEVYTGMPGVVVSYDPSSKRASVQPSLPRGFRLRGDREVERLPVINEVPILWPSFMGGVRMKGILIPGDPVWIMFSQRSTDRWKAGGGVIDDTGDDRMHHVSDAFAYPGGRPDGSDGNPQIEFTLAGEIHAGGSDSLALRDELQAVVDQLNNHVHSGVTTGAGNSGLPLALDPSAPVSLFPGPTGTTVLKGG